MNKILETHYDLTNNSSQVRVIDEDFHKYVYHLQEANGRYHSRIITDINNTSNGCTLGVSEKIISIHQNTEDTFVFKKYNSHLDAEIIVALVIIDNLKII